MAFARSDGGRFESPIAEIQVYRVRFRRTHQNIDTTGGGETAPEYTKAGLRYYSGVANGWVTSGGPDWESASGTLTLSMADGQSIRGEAMIELLQVDSNLLHNSFIPVLFTFDYTGSVTIGETCLDPL